jgi:simple sugar transport system substrate-binding protein
MKKTCLLISALVVTGLSLAFAGGGQQQGGAEAKKIAVIRNMTSSDHTAQFFAGCIAEGNALGFTVDTFMSDGDDVKMQDLMEQALQKDYTIWIVSHANEGYQYDMISKAVNKGIKVVGFDCGGQHVPGVTYTSQNDESLAKISLDALIEKSKANGAKEPITIIEVNTLGAIVPFDNRHKVIEQYVKDSKLKIINMIAPSLAGDFYSGIFTGVSTTLTNNPKGAINGIWTASSAFIDGASDAITEARRNEIIITAIDISDTEIQRLVEDPAYYCCAAVDPYVIGIVDVRLAILKTLSIETPETVQLDAVGVFADKVQAGDTMKTLNKYFENFGATDLYNTKEIQELRAKFAK